MKRQLAVAAAAALVLTGVLVPAGAATAAGRLRPWIRVSPATGLRSGQIVTVTGGGLSDRPLGLDECRRGAKLPSQCDADTRSFGITLTDHRFRESMQVVRDPAGLQGLDCARRRACEIALLSLGRGTIVILARVGVTFSATARPIVPHISLSTERLLVPNEQVTVRGAGLGPDTTFRLLECAGSPSGSANLLRHCGLSGYGYPGSFGGYSLGYSVSNDRGTFSITTRADGEIVEPFGGSRAHVTDCRHAPGCEFLIQAFDPASPSVTGRLPLRFDPVAWPVTPVIDVSDPSGLANGQEVTVSGGPFAPGEPVAVRECPSSTAVWASCSIADVATGVAGRSGIASVTFAVSERSAPGVAPPEDCASVQCSLTIVGADDVWYSAWVPVTFDAAAHEIRPHATAAPATALGNGSLVTVSGSGYVPGAPLSVEECQSDGRHCSFFGAQVTADALGDAEFGVNVSSTLQYFVPATNSTTTVDCGSAGCLLKLSNSQDWQQRATIPLAFAG